MKSKENKGPKSSKAKGDRAKDIRRAEEMSAQARALELTKAISSTKQNKVRKRTDKVGKHLKGLFSFIDHEFTEGWVPHSFNGHRQKIEYFKTFCFKHYVPSVLILDATTNSDSAPLSKAFLSIIASGESFYKRTKNIFTKKEAHYLLSSTKANDFYTLFFEAKVRARDIDLGLGNIIISVFAEKFPDIINSRRIKLLRDENVIALIIEFLDFITRNQDYAWTKNEISDIADFVRANFDRHRAPNSAPTPYDRFADFSFAGRTVGSVSRVVNEWHKVLAENRPVVRPGRPFAPAPPSSWNGYNVDNLDTQVKQQGSTYNYRITQLKTTNELYREGQNMHHCVGSYASWAASGKCAIFSVTRVEHGRRGGKVENVATIELVHMGGGSYRIAQLRAKCNKEVDSLTKTVVERWKREKA